MSEHIGPSNTTKKKEVVEIDEQIDANVARPIQSNYQTYQYLDL